MSNQMSENRVGPRVVGGNKYSGSKEYLLSQERKATEKELHWMKQLEPLVSQMTHRKNDYGTILSFLQSVDPQSSRLIVPMRKAERVPREIGHWFIVRAEERAVVRLGIGSNPGLKKYYWRANGSKRLLKREMEDDNEPADLVYIIQKAHNVSKRCVSLPDTDYWLVMYLPSTLRASKSKQSPDNFHPSSMSTAISPSRRAGPAGAGPTRKRKRPVSPAKKAGGPSTQTAQYALQKKGFGPTSSVRRGPIKKVVRSQQQQTAQKHPQQQHCGGGDDDGALPTRPDKRQRRDSLAFLFKLCEPFSFQTSAEATAENHFATVGEEADEENVDVNILDDDDDQQKQPAQKHPQQQPANNNNNDNSSSSTDATDDLDSASDEEALGLAPPSSDAEDFDPLGLSADLSALFGDHSHEVVNSFNPAPPTSCAADEPDPFLPLAGSQTGFSAALEAACMAGYSNLSLSLTDLPHRVLPSTVSFFDGFDMGIF